MCVCFLWPMFKSTHLEVKFCSTFGGPIKCRIHAEKMRRIFSCSCKMQIRDGDIFDIIYI